MADTRRDRRQNGKSSRSGILLGIAGALIAALLVYQVFLKSDDTPTASTAAPPSAAVAKSGTTTTTAPLEPELPNGSFDELSLRDPFEPVGQIDDGTTVDTTPTTPDTTPPDTTVEIPPTPTNSPAQSPVPTSEVALLDVTNVNGASTARVRVGDDEYTVVAGQTFGPANNYLLVAFTSESCANFTYADSPFSLCTGEQVVK
jgi:hypothetical protein